MKHGYRKWRCRCSCGNECITYKENLTCGNTKSCGCLQEEKRRENMKKAIHFVDGTFTDLKAAVKARKEKEEELFGTFLEEYYASEPESRTAAL
ncbi:MAG: hypothetical protein Q4A04_07070 [Eubacteriales bacterium]|nr:hypothetical protein [Eubacteriales bacterium]